MGGVYARAAAEGIHTILVTATRGEEGEALPPDLQSEETRSRLGEIREKELRRACEILAIDQLYFLDYRDSGMVGTPPNADLRNFQNADLDEATERLVRIIRLTRPNVVVTSNEWGNYGHPDHIAANRVAVAAFDAAGDSSRFSEHGLEPWQPHKLYYIEFARSDFLRLREKILERGLPVPFEGGDSDPDATSDTVPDEAITARVDVADYFEQKDAAIRVHRSQMFGHPLLNLPEDIARDFAGCETFRLVRSSVPVPAQETDLFTGLR